MQENLVAKMEAFPGVVAAGFTNFLPATGATLRFQLTLEGPALTEESGRITVGERGISSGYLKALSAPLLAGQDCPSLRALTRDAPKALVSRRFEQMYGDGRNLVGRHLRW